MEPTHGIAIGCGAFGENQYAVTVIERMGNLPDGIIGRGFRAAMNEHGASFRGNPADQGPFANLRL